MFDCKTPIINLLKSGLLSGMAVLSPNLLASPNALPAASILLSQNNTDLLSSDPYQNQRAIFLQAEQALDKRHYKTYQKLAQQLKNYPLLPYLQYKNLRRQISTLNKHQIRDFLESSGESLVADNFRKKLIRHFDKKNRWHDLIDIYQPQASTSLQCKYLNALIQTGNSTQAYSKATKLWLSATSLPKSCDKVITKWQQAGKQTDKLVWQRIELAMNKGNSRLATYLAKSLTSKDRRWVDMWIKLRRHPENANKFNLFNSQHPVASNIRTYTIKRLSRTDPQQAMALWKQTRLVQSFSETQTNSIYRAIGLSLARQQHPDAPIWLNKIPLPYHDKHSLEWSIRTAIRHANWPQTISAIERLPTTDQANLRWQFWWAYAQEQLGNSIDAEGIFHYLATRRSYYGFLAADHLNLPYAFEDRPVEFSNMELNSIIHHSAALRARELYKLDRILDARREWYDLIQSLNRRQKLAASKLAQHWQWHDRAIYTMGKTDYRDDIELRFPLPMKDMVESWSAKQSIEPALTYAIIRRESAFMADARSHVGALGLMQIMPRTARHIARKMKVKYRGKHSLLSADTNLKLGTGYLSQMLKRLSMQQVLATAAYNAGPNRVQQWLPEAQPMDAIRWIETIPFTETREYVSNVLAYTTIYQYLLNDQYTRLSARMPQIPARNPQPKTAIIQEVALLNDKL